MFIVMRNDYNEPWYFTTVEDAILYVEEDLIPNIKSSYENRHLTFVKRGNGWAVDNACQFIRIEKLKLWQSVLKPDK